MALSITPSILYPTAQLAAAAALIFSAPSSVGSGVTVTKTVVSNPTSAAATFTLWRVAAGGSVNNADMLVPPRSIPAGDAVIISEVNGMVLGPGDAVYASASAAATLNLTMSGYTFVSA